MSETCLERWKRTTPHFTCPRCDAVSFNPNDIRELYCGRCHLFFAHDFVRNRPPSYGAFAERPHPPAKRHEAGFATAKPRHDDDVSNPFPTFSTPSYDPPAAPDFDPGGGSSGGGGASGDW
jgi:uncharacterized membrane protein YgcG